MNPIKEMKLNPIWLAFGTVWLPSVIANYVVMPIDIKTILIYVIIGMQMYCLFVGINRMKSEKKYKDKKTKKIR